MTDRAGRPSASRPRTVPRHRRPHDTDRGAAHPNPRPSQPSRAHPQAAALRQAERSQRLTAAWLLAPAAVLLITFLLIPIALTFALAFTNARLISPQGPRVHRHRQLHPALRRPGVLEVAAQHVLFAVVVVPLQSACALVLALLVNVKIRGVNFFRTVYFLPVVTSMVVVSMLWLFMYQPDGLINQVLPKFGIDGPGLAGQPDTRRCPRSCSCRSGRPSGFHMVIWLSGLQTIPQDLYEAADLDGASTWQKFRYVTWPGLRQTRTFILITITISAFSLFTQVNVMTQGGPLDSTTHPRVPGGPRRLPAAADRLRLGDLAGLLRAGARRLPGPALPHPRQGREEMSDTLSPRRRGSAARAGRASGPARAG